MQARGITLLGTLALALLGAVAEVRAQTTADLPELVATASLAEFESRRSDPVLLLDTSTQGIEESPAELRRLQLQLYQSLALSELELDALAYARAERLPDAFAHTGEDAWQLRATLVRAELSQAMGLQGRAQADLSSAMAVARAKPGLAALSPSLRLRAVAWRIEAGQFDQARRVLADLERDAELSPDQLAAVALQRAQLERRTINRSRAVASFQRAAELYREAGNLAGTADVYRAEAQWRCESVPIDPLCGELLQRAAALASRLGNSVGASSLDLDRFELALNTEDFDTAQTVWQQSLATSLDDNMLPASIKRRAWRLRLQLDLARDDVAAALDSARGLLAAASSELEAEPNSVPDALLARVIAQLGAQQQRFADTRFGLISAALSVGLMLALLGLSLFWRRRQRHLRLLARHERQRHKQFAELADFADLAVNHEPAELIYRDLIQLLHAHFPQAGFSCLLVRDAARDSFVYAAGDGVVLDQVKHASIPAVPWIDILSEGQQLVPGCYRHIAGGRNRLDQICVGEPITGPPEELLVLQLPAVAEPVGIVLLGSGINEAYADVDLPALEATVAQLGLLLTHVSTRDELTRQRSNAENAQEEANEAQMTLQRLAHEDPLTGLANRRLMRQRLEEEVARAARASAQFGLVVAKIDDFAELGEYFGKETLRALLCDLSARLVQQLRGQDVIARWSDEEFLLMLPDTKQAGSIFVAEKLAASVARQAFAVGEQRIDLTMSFGVATYELGRELDDVIRAASKALSNVQQMSHTQVHGAG